MDLGFATAKAGWVNVRGVKRCAGAARPALDLHIHPSPGLALRGHGGHRHRGDVSPTLPEIVGVVVLPLPEAAAALLRSHETAEDQGGAKKESNRAQTTGKLTPWYSHL
jgi:hypothetical protein